MDQLYESMSTSQLLGPTFIMVHSKSFPVILSEKNRNFIGKCLLAIAIAKIIHSYKKKTQLFVIKLKLNNQNVFFPNYSNHDFSYYFNKIVASNDSLWIPIIVLVQKLKPNSCTEMEYQSFRLCFNTGMILGANCIMHFSLLILKLVVLLTQAFFVNYSEQLQPILIGCIVLFFIILKQL